MEGFGRRAAERERGERERERALALGLAGVRGNEETSSRRRACKKSSGWNDDAGLRQKTDAGVPPSLRNFSVRDEGGIIGLSGRGAHESSCTLTGAASGGWTGWRVGQRTARSKPSRSAAGTGGTSIYRLAVQCTQYCADHRVWFGSRPSRGGGRREAGSACG